MTHSDILCICTPIGDNNLIFLSVLTKHNNVCFVCCRYCEVRDQISMSRAGDGESLMEDEEMEVEC